MNRSMNPRRNDLRIKLAKLIPVQCSDLPKTQLIGPCGLRRPCGLIQAVELLEESGDPARHTPKRPFKG